MILIVEDDKNFASILKLEFEERGHVCLCIDRPDEIFSLPKNIMYALIDMNVGKFHGTDFINKIKEKFPKCRQVILTGFGSISSAVEAIKMGAEDYLTKPVDFELIYDVLIHKKLSSETTEKLPSLARKEREYIEFILKQNKGNITKTAKDLGLHRQSLQRKLKKFTPS